MNEKKTHEKVSYLRRILDDNAYIVALCGSDMMRKGDFIDIKEQDKAYDIENRYGYGVGEMYSSAFYNIHPKRLFEFYGNEMLHNAPRDIPASPVLAAIERGGKPQCVVDSNIHDSPRRGGCRQVVSLHGNIYQNQCPRCKKKYPLSYIMSARHVPICETCNIPIRPTISLVGEMVDSRNMTKTTEKITKADVLLPLRTTVASEVFKQYIKYFTGSHIVIIHEQGHYLDREASLVILGCSVNVLPKFRYREKA